MKKRVDPRLLDHKGEPEEWAAIRRHNEQRQNEVNKRAIRGHDKRQPKDS